MIEVLIGVVVLTYGVITGTHALMTTRDPRSALGWTVSSLLLPALGATAYWFFGVNRIKTKAKRWRERGRFNLNGGRAYGDAKAELAHVHPDRAETMSTLTRISDRVTRRPLLRGNTIKPLHNGEEAYPPMLAAIAGAQRTIYLCTYLFETEGVGRAFVDGLIAAGERGVDVRVLVDALGERASAGKRVSKLLAGCKGIKLARFLPLALSWRVLGVNLRNHRKILIVDSDLGFTGGMNIGARNMVKEEGNREPTEDLHFQVTGPVVYELEDTFFEDWQFSTGEGPPWGEDEECSLEPTGDAVCRAISDGPNEDFEVLTWILVGALSAARTRIQILTPYFRGEVRPVEV